MKNLLRWLKESNRLSHLIGGVCIGLFSDNLYCAAYAGIGVASALELKDKMWGGSWDWKDLGLTVLGVSVGFSIRCAVCGKLYLYQR